MPIDQTKYAACCFPNEAVAFQLADKAKVMLLYSLEQAGAVNFLRFDGPRTGLFSDDPELWGMAAYGKLDLLIGP